MSIVQVTVLVTSTAAFPHASDTLNDLVCDSEHGSPVTFPSVAVGIPTEQLSVAVAVPRAALISAAVGLHPSARVVPVAEITGASVSIVQITVRVTVIAAFPHASVTLNVLVWDSEHGSPITLPSVATTIPTEQLSVAVAEPNAASICEAVGLHPRDKVVPVAVITGTSVSIVQVLSLIHI